MGGVEDKADSHTVNLNCDKQLHLILLCQSALKKGNTRSG